jgi:Protein of unknown function (DUF3147)
MTWEMIHLKFSALKESRWYEYLIRFVLGGLATCLAGLVADIGGPALGGLFLSFPAIFLASATLIEAHERRRKRERGLHGNRRGRQAAALDAAGATSVAPASLHSPLWYGCRRRHYRSGQL